MQDPLGKVCQKNGTGRATWIAGALVTGIYLAHVVYYWVQVNDDAFITFRYSKFLALGRGPYFNVGEHVEGYTNPLLMLVMSLALALSGTERALAIAKGIGAAAGCASLVFTWLLCRSWLAALPSLAARASILAWIGPALLATQAAYALQSTTGLETTLFAAGIVLGLWLLQSARDANRWKGAGVAFALVALTRPEGAAVLAVALAAEATGGALRDPSARRRWLLDAAVGAAAVAALLAFRLWAYDGQLVPNTYYAKLGGMSGQSTPARYLLGLVSRHLAWVGWLPALLPLLLAPRDLRRAILPALAVAGFGVLAIFATGPDWMPGYRLLVPYLPAWAALSALGVALLAERLAPRRTWAGIAAGFALAAALFAWQQPARASYRSDAVLRARGYREGHQALADWLLARARTGATVALMDIGIVGFRCIDWNVLDLTGLTDRTIAFAPGGFLRKQFPLSYVLDRRPDVVVIVFTGPTELRADRPQRLIPWTEIERRLVADREFGERYVRPRPVDPRASVEEQLAARYGAARVFRHAYPRRSYLLFAYALAGD